MSLLEESWQGRVGRRLFLINARSARSAVALAMEFCSDHAFTTEEILHDAYSLESLPLREDEPFAPFDGLEGAWAITVVRVGHAWSSSGSEYHSDYHIEAFEFEGPAPHRQPHYEDDANHWSAVRLSWAEKKIMTKETTASTSARSSRKTL